MYTIALYIMRIQKEIGKGVRRGAKPKNSNNKTKHTRTHTNIINTKMFENEFIWALNYEFNGRHLRNEKSKTDWWVCARVFSSYFEK